MKLCNGDFHTGNIVGPSGNNTVDWLNATRGDPLADVRRSYVLMRPARPDFAEAYVVAYAAAAGCPRDAIQPGCPSSPLRAEQKACRAPRHS